MGRRSRKRARPAAERVVDVPPAAPVSRKERERSRRDRLSPPPWAPFPLVELIVLLALVLLVAGFVVRGHRGTLMIGAGLVLGTLAGLELSIREHFAGYRSHTFLLSGAVAVAVLAGLYFLASSLWLPIALAITLAAFAAAAVGLTRVFQRRSGRAFKLR